jgi:hypothetical protein
MKKNCNASKKRAWYNSSKHEGATVQSILMKLGMLVNVPYSLGFLDCASKFIIFIRVACLALTTLVAALRYSATALASNNAMTDHKTGDYLVSLIE